MSADLSKEANELVQAGQLAFRPTSADRQRVFEALQARLQPQGTSEAGAPKERGIEPNAERLNLSTLGKFALVTGGLIASFVALSVNFSPSSREVVEHSGARSSGSSEPTSSQPGEMAASGSESSVNGATDPAASARTNLDRSPYADSLAAEAALLSQAEKALHAGNLNRALLLTSEHRKKFPKGLMLQERVNIRVQSLCGLGRDGEADKELARFRRSRNIEPGQACRQK